MDDYRRLERQMMAQKFDMGGNILVRPLQAEDVDKCAHTFCFSWVETLGKSVEKWQRYYEEHVDGSRFVYVIQRDDGIVGYGTLLYTSECRSLRDEKIPEINDVWISEGVRFLGLGTTLISSLEQIARDKGYTRIGIGVGLYSDYGPAQRLYWKLGYCPDGQGITYRGVPVVPGEQYIVDDDLILWMLKAL